MWPDFRVGILCNRMSENSAYILDSFFQGITAKLRRSKLRSNSPCVQNNMEVDKEALKIPKYIESLSFSKGGELALTASNLTSRKWNGVLAIYSDPHFAPAVPHIDIGVETEAGGSDVTWIDEKRLLVASDSGAVDLWTVVDNGRAMENTLSYLEHSGICSSICLNNSKQQVVSGSYDGSVKIWDLEVDVSVHTLRAHSDKVLCVAWSQSHSDLFASVSQDGDVYVYDMRDAKPARLLVSEKFYNPCSIAWHPSEERVAVGYNNGKIILKDSANSSKNVAEYHLHTKNVNRIAFSQQSQHLIASVSDDLKLHVQDMANNSSILDKKVHDDYIRGLAWDLEKMSCWTCAWDGRVKETLLSDRS